MIINKATDVDLEHRGILKLRPSDHKATGGEGSIYVASGTVVKIYTDPNKMRRENISDKINLLSKVKHPCIVAPKGLVKTVKGDPIGYYMDYVEAEPMARLFTSDFQKGVGFGKDEMVKLTHNMQETVRAAHNHQAVMVDANEMNWLVDLRKQKEPVPRVIDVDSWAIGNWPAQVIMPSIRDWHSQGFDQNTDWFAWGIVSFQIYTGIHPYKGVLDGFKRGDLEGRMKANASVFTSGVRLNSAVRDFGLIPGQLLDWYESTFQNGLRSAPPSPLAVGLAKTMLARRQHVQVTATGTLIYDKLFEDVTDEVLRLFPCGAILLKSGKVVDLGSRRVICQKANHDCEIVKVERGWLRGEIENGLVKFCFINETSLVEELLPMEVNARKIVRFDNRLFVVTEKGLSELSLRYFGKPILSLGNTWGVMVNATNWFDGVGVQDAFGATFVIAPFGANSCAQVRVRELDGWRVIAAKAGQRFMSLIALSRNGQYRKFELTFTAQYESYQLWQADTDSAELNMAILPRGVVTTIVNDGELCVFVPVNGAMTKINDKFITFDMKLANWDEKVVYVKDGSVWSIRMAPK